MKEGREDKSPILGSWKAVYLLMAAVLLVLAVFFYFFTKYFK